MLWVWRMGCRHWGGVSASLGRAAGVPQLATVPAPVPLEEQQMQRAEIKRMGFGLSPHLPRNCWRLPQNCCRFPAFKQNHLQLGLPELWRVSAEPEELSV